MIEEDLPGGVSGERQPVDRSNTIGGWRELVLVMSDGQKVVHSSQVMVTGKGRPEMSPSSLETFSSFCPLYHGGVVLRQ